jgi:integrase
MKGKTGINCHPHLLRHTFGTYELLRMMHKKEEKLALMWVMDRMGHSSITTTEKYIHAVDLIQHDDVDDRSKTSSPRQRPICQCQS